MASLGITIPSVMFYKKSNLASTITNIFKELWENMNKCLEKDHENTDSKIK